MYPNHNKCQSEWSSSPFSTTGVSLHLPPSGNPGWKWKRKTMVFSQIYNTNAGIMVPDESLDDDPLIFMKYLR